MDVRIYLTGQVGLAVDGTLVISERDFRGRQARLAFAYLILERHRQVSREELVDIIWPESLPAVWETAVSAVVSRIRGLLSRAGLGPEWSVRRGLGHYQIRFPGGTWVDLEAAAEAVDSAEGALRAGDMGRAWSQATVAATITSYPFLPGIRGEWAEQQRVRLQRVLLRSLECQAIAWLASGQAALAVEAASRAVGLDRLREGSYQVLIRALRAAGHPAEAITTYHRLRRILADELGTDPAPETQALFSELLG